MCGIIGGFTKHDPGALAERARTSIRAIAHRGPDDRQLLVEACGDAHVLLGHTRLAIIDLTPGGTQPMTSADGRFTIVFNGEVYNYVELRKTLSARGVRFSSESDTEVLLEAWARWGRGCLPQLIGMFAFAVLDRQERTVTLVRDAFGVKPLYYATTEGATCFASELPALVQLANLPRKMNDQVAVNYLVTGELDIGPETFFEGAHALLPAHMMTFKLDSGRSSVERWWNPSIAEVGGRTRAQAADELRSLFLESVRVHMRSDVPVGIALSGGIDSSAIACGVRHVLPDAELHTFSYVAEDGAISEEPWIDVVNQSIGATVHKIGIGPDDLQADLDRLIQAQGEPFGGTMLYAQFRVFRAARDAGVKVVLEGQGGDEMLGGYMGYPGFVVRSRLERFDVQGAVHFARGWTKAHRDRGVSRYRSLLSELPFPGRMRRARRRWIDRLERLEWMLPDVSSGPPEHAYGRPFEGSPVGRRLMETLLLSMTRYSLPHLLRYGDRNAMAFSIENRVPFVTTQLAEFVLSLPEEFLVDGGGRTKSLFRMAMRGIVPDAVLERSDKVGFATPMRRWMRQPMLQRMATLVDLRQRTMVRTRAACDFISEELFEAAERDLDWTAWRVFNLLAWQQEFDMASSRP